MYDVAVIGGGVTGCMLLRELARYKLKTVLLEKSSDFACGASKANSAIVHAGYDAEEGTLKAKLNAPGCEMMYRVAKELDVHIKKVGSLVIIFDESERPQLEKLYRRGISNGVPELRIIEKEELHKLEPELTDEAIAALYAPTAGITCPYEMTIAAAENAADNGAQIIREFEVCSLKRDNDGISLFDREAKREIKARFVVNCAGVFADEIAKMAGDDHFEIIPNRGEYMIGDKNSPFKPNTVLFTLPNEKGKGILYSRTVDDNVIIGPNSHRVEKDDTTVTAQGLEEILKGAQRLMPINTRSVITSFAGVRPSSSTKDFIVEPSRHMQGLLHAAGIESPGFASSVAMAKYLVENLDNMGLELEENPDFNPFRRKMNRFRDMNNEERNAMIAENPMYGNIICRCETVTEAEIVSAIRRNAGAYTVDAVKRRTRAGMGRCQGGFCSPKVCKILSRELGIPMNEVTKNGGCSYILTQRTKD
ncbi:MAG: NAD(P)/FAD-dependent oxidoreductase [Ruminococcaceae bacterium]|nr:NAD(P)/FAD-dependent oxidoreductase [Oscillospiraceae bacterium]